MNDEFQSFFINAHHRARTNIMYLISCIMYWGATFLAPLMIFYFLLDIGSMLNTTKWSSAITIICICSIVLALCYMIRAWTEVWPHEKWCRWTSHIINLLVSSFIPIILVVLAYLCKDILDKFLKAAMWSTVAYIVGLMIRYFLLEEYKWYYSCRNLWAKQRGLNSIAHSYNQEAENTVTTLGN